ncbi:MBL fold metallo-hydrolase [Patescibacteria group bacterium]|nr:MBL fold metallo-hydrolase [Patescibacteria group bacterium]
MKNLKWYFLGVLFLLSIFIWYAVFSEERSDILTVAFLDVGQGDAIFIESPNGNQILIDGGANKKVLAELSGVMPAYDRSIDALILTHPHQDHIGGLVEVLKRYEVDYTFEPGTLHAIAEFSEWEKLTEENDIERIFAKRGMRIWLEDDIYFDVLSPRENEVATGDINEAMVVGRLVYGSTSFLLTGDLDRGGEFNLLLEGDILESDVLKVAHHGSKNSTTGAFLDAVAPQLAVIMVGRKNRYGHPHAQTIRKLQAAGIRIFRTDTDGTIIVESDGENIYFTD